MAADTETPDLVDDPRAAAMWRRLGETLGAVTPAGFLTLDDAVRKRRGVSCQRTA